MAITGVSSISGQQIIAAGALSAASAGTALYDENGKAITSYLTAVPEGYATTADLTGKQDVLTFGYDGNNAISSINESAIAGGGTTYTSPSGTILINGNTLEGTNSAILSDSYTFGGENNSTVYVSALPDYPYTKYTLVHKQDALSNHCECSVNYGTSEWEMYGILIFDDGLTHEIPLTSGGKDLMWIQNLSYTNYEVVANKEQVVELALKSDLPTDYLTTGDSANFYTTANESGFISEVPDTYLQNTDLTISDGKVTEISGVPLSAGTELEFEYDAADNISAINSSAISTTPSQALYAQNPLYFSATGTSSYMGINSADLARMLGVDETVLWSGARQTTGTIQLTESMWNYDLMDIYVCPDYNTYSTRMGYQITRLTVIPQTDANEQLLCYAKSNRIASNTYLSELFYLRFNPNGDSVDFSPGIKWSNNTVTTGVTAFTGAVTKIVGIGRKEV